MLYTTSRYLHYASVVVIRIRDVYYLYLLHVYTRTIEQNGLIYKTQTPTHIPNNNIIYTQNVCESTHSFLGEKHSK